MTFNKIVLEQILSNKNGDTYLYLLIYKDKARKKLRNLAQKKESIKQTNEYLNEGTHTIKYKNILNKQFKEVEKQENELKEVIIRIDSEVEKIIK